MAKKKKPIKPKQCHHIFGEMKYESDEPKGYQVCLKCGRTKFEGEKRIF